ncbi:MAG TPA: DUF4097 family beta strand repeat-containing protein [Dehalococcoidia bacterium]|jgi:DUF4097 and DUF4098 domain-containing protein YvlB|nr:DUF4097 family beta strand repeat-containing protein [Dehalococcoidia bacterium]
MGTRYSIPPGARLKVLGVSGKVRVISEGRTDIEIDPPERRIEIHDDGRVMETRSRSTNLEIRVPHGLNVSIGTVSGDVELDGRFGTVKVSSVSGSIKIGDTAGDADIRSIAGQIVVGDCGGCCRANTKSGRIAIEHVGGEVLAHTMSGSIQVGTAGRDEVSLKTISGRLEVHVDRGRAPRAKLRTLSGKISNALPPGDDFELRASTISGSIEVSER